jgi:hypothetical protein
MGRTCLILRVLNQVYIPIDVYRYIGCMHMCVQMGWRLCVCVCEGMRRYAYMHAKI